MTGAGRSRRRHVPLVGIRARVSPDAHARAHAVAEALGVSMAEYVDALLLHDRLDDAGRPVWWTRPVRANHEEPPKSA